MKPCNQCGKCCILYSDGGLTATPDEIQVWHETNPEIYRYVNNGNIWMDPETGIIAVFILNVLMIVVIIR